MKLIISLRILCFVLLNVLNFQSALSQSISFKLYGRNEGYPHGANAFMQDSSGFIWMKDATGLFRFDGYEFRTYLTENFEKTFDQYSIVSHQAPNFAVHHTKFRMYDPRSDSFRTHLDLSKNHGINAACFEENKNVVWLARWAQGLLRLNLETGDTIPYVNRLDHGLPEDYPNTIGDVRDLGNELLLGTRGGVWIFDKEKKEFRRPAIEKKWASLFFQGNVEGTILVHKQFYWFVFFTPPGIHFVKTDSNFTVLKSFNFSQRFKTEIGEVPHIVSMAIDADEIIWMCTDGQGLIKLDPSTDKIENFRHSKGDIHSLPSDRLGAILIDREQNLWITTGEGICKIKKSSLNFYNYLPGQAVLEIGVVNNAATKQLLVNTYGSALWNSKIVSAPDKFNFEELAVEGIVTGQPGQVSIGRDNLWFLNGQGVTGLPINHQTGLVEKKGAVYFQAHDGGPNKNALNLLSANFPIRVLEDPLGNLWVGHYSNRGLDKIFKSSTTGEFTSIRFQHDEKDTTSIAAIPLTSEIFWDQDTSLWIAINGGIEHLKDDHFFHVNKRITAMNVRRVNDGTLVVGTRTGLYLGNSQDNYKLKKVELIGTTWIGGVREDLLGRLWVATRNGLFCYNRKQGTVINFTDEDGIIGANLITIEKISENLMAVGTSNGISLFDPLSLDTSQYKVKPVLTNLLINNHPVEIGQSEGADFRVPQYIQTLKELTLDHTHNIFTIAFASMEFADPKKNQYAYRLDGYDDDWVYASDNRSASYTNMDPGMYTFRVKASNHNGVWSDYERKLKIRILPPPWRTWWAYSSYGLMVAGLLLWARRSIVQRERLKSNLELEKVEREKEHFELEKAKEVDRVKTSFFTNISHEFRTPLTLIKGPVQDLMEKYASEPRTQEKLKLVQRNSELLLKLINQLLDLAKLESGSLKVEKTEGDVFSFVRAVTSSFHSFGAQKNVDVIVEVPFENVNVLFDKDKVETILINLINNAIKFTPANGKVSVSGSIANSELTLSVKDTGIGIPDDQRSKIFERFHQVSEAHKQVGTGIGLSLVKELVALLGGTISVESVVGKGSEFTVILPIEGLPSVSHSEVQTPGVDIQPARENMEINRSQNGRSEKEPATRDADQTGLPTILIVEDNTDLRHFIIDSLGNEFQYVEAEDGLQGLEKANSEIPDLIVSDVMMPEMDGITMTGKIKKDIHTCHIPLILLTAKSSEDSMLSGLSSGADDYLTKPFNKNELLLKVRNAVNRQIKLRERLRAELMSTAPPVHVLSEDEIFLNSVKEKILERLGDEQLSVESLAEDMGMSRVQLYRKVSGLTDISVNELIRKLRLQRAAQLLSQNWGPVSQVAYEVGFSNLSYFSKVFKEEFEVLPSEYSGK